MQQAVAEKEAFLASLHDRAAAWLDAGCHAQALAGFDQVVAQAPTWSVAWLNRGSALRYLGRFDEALSSYDRALALDPEMPEVHFNRGMLCLMELHDLPAAAQGFDRARIASAELARALSFSWLARRQMCDWSQEQALRLAAAEAVGAQSDAVLPFPALAMTDDPALHRRVAGLHAQGSDVAPPNAAQALEHVRPQCGRGRRLRVGYYSSDFHEHATMRLMAELFERHDHTRFEWFAFSFGPDQQDAMRRRARAAFDHFLDVRERSDLDVARLSRELGIDVAVDLKGYTTDSRPAIFAYRCAPVQVSYLGYPGTLGATWMDYLVADATLIPAGARQHYSEQVVYLPHSYQCNDRSRDVSQRTFTRAELGLPEHGVVYCCFNNNYKICPQTFDGWMRILKEVPGSVLWLLQDNEWVATNLRREAEARGVSSQRLVFAPRVPQSDHLARQRAADLFLDTWPYNAHTTASDALWVGLPVLTLAGASFAARVGASLLNAVGLSELVAERQEDYEALAISLGSEPQRLKALRQHLETTVLEAPLFDNASLARALEWAYERMHERSVRGEKPQVLIVPPDRVSSHASSNVWIQRGLALHRQGQLPLARSAYEQALRLDPNEPDALQLLGVCLSQLREHDEAVRCLERAAALRQSHAVTLSNLGGALREAGRLTEALARYDEAIAHQSGLVDAWLNRGHVLHDLGHYTEALESYGKAQTLNPEAARQMPVDAVHNQGVALLGTGRLLEALTVFDRVIERVPDLAVAWYNRGHVLEKLHRLEEARNSYQHSLHLKPDQAEWHNSLGFVLLALRRIEEALAAYTRALELKPAFPIAWNNHGHALQELGRMSEALTSYERATKLDPTYGLAYNNQAAVLDDLHRYDVAAERFRMAYETDPTLRWTWGHRVTCQQAMCDWRERREDEAALQRHLTQGHRMCTPFPVLSMLDSAAHQRMAAQIYANETAPLRGDLGPAVAKSPAGRRLRVAYYSADFHDHATMRLMAELFERHDRIHFEWFAFSFGPDRQDAMRRRAQTAFEQFLDVRRLSDLEIAQLSRELGIDVAIDLKGFTMDSRPGIFAYRCAPVQVSYLGYPGTLGAPWMDYLLADQMLIPEESRRHYSEQVVYLPRSYQCNDRFREISPQVFSRVELGLPEQAFVYCCFNNNYKISPQAFVAWMQILKAVPNSVLWLLQDNEWAADNLRREAKAHGVQSQRLVFAPRMPQAQHLARQRAADLFLDTWPCNAHTTASDALWVGLPVLTLVGDSFAARVGASLLNAVGLPELVTERQEDYEQLAIALGRKPGNLGYLRQRLISSVAEAPLFDNASLARALEGAYEHMYKRAMLGLKPDSFVVDVHTHWS